MSGELQIVFIYDTLRCRREEDDPKDAILYFHPADIAEERRIAICGQLMGITQFFVHSFSAPQILTLENGKFALRKFGKQYILALGCSSITPDWLLEKQADILYSLTRFFHRDIQSVLDNANGDRDLLTTKLTAMMDHYIPVSQHHGDLFALTFGILPILSLPKSANNISLQGSLILQTCMMKNGVLGGIVMFQNKVVGVELSQNVAQKLAFIQPYSLPPADMVKVDFKLPPGVQLFTVYVWEHELDMLRKRASGFLHPSTSDDDPTTKDSINLSIDPIREEDPSDVSSSIGFSEVSSSLGLEDTSNNGNSLTGSSAASDSEVKLSHLVGDELMESGVASAECDLKLKISSDGKGKACSLKPCSHLSAFASCQLRRTRSAEDLICAKEHSCKPLCSSLADPEFPYVLCDGRSVSKDFVEYVIAPAEQMNQELKGSASETDLCQAALLPEPIILTPEVPQNELPAASVPTPSSVRRPMNLPLNAAPTSNRHKNRRWSTFEDMMSPIGGFTSLLQETPILNEQKDFLDSQANREEKSFTTDQVPDKIHSRMINSFKKLSSHEDLSSYPSSSDNEKVQENEPPPPPQIPKSLFPIKLRKEHGGNSTTTSKLQQPWDEKYEKAYLYMYSHGSMRLLLLMDTKSSIENSVIQALHDYGLVGLSELEKAITNVEELNLSMGSGQNDPYCYLRYEPVWKSLAQGGRNQSMDFEIVQFMHRDFASYPNLSELIIRGEDHVVYGYQCVGSEVYYQQSANVLSGLPMPSDLMGKVPLEAKNRLERDHNIILL